MIGLKMSEPTRYAAFIQGKDSSPMHEVLSDEGLMNSTCNDLLLKNETYDFASGVYEVNVGKLSFNKTTRDELLKTVSLLSKYTDLKI